MQQIHDIGEHLHLIQQGNNSYIHRKSNLDEEVQQYQFQSQVIKSVFHSQLLFEQEDNKIHQRECSDLANEWKILSSLNHPYIVKPYAFIPNHRLESFGGNLQCCSLFLESAFCDLHTICKQNDKTMPLKTIIKYFKQIAMGVEHLHSQYIAHNDIKLENILVMPRGIAKLADFGFAYNPPQDLITKWIPRTLNYYTSPEIVNFRNQLYESAEPYQFEEFSSFASDVYALATSLFVAIYKRPPIMGSVPNLNDQYYQMLVHDPDLFWSLEFIQKIDNQLMREHVPKALLESLKDLLECGLVEEYSRITIDNFVNHEFFDQGEQLEEEKI